MILNIKARFFFFALYFDHIFPLPLHLPTYPASCAPTPPQKKTKHQAKKPKSINKKHKKKKPESIHQKKKNGVCFVWTNT